MATRIDPLSLPTVLDGHYAKKQLGCKNRLIAWSHRRRFETALKLAKRVGGKTILDYGCGDGTLLALLENSDLPFDTAMGAELTDEMAENCKRRLQSAKVDFCSIASLQEKSFRCRFDTVFCLEVLEHVVAVEAVVSNLYEFLVPGGTLVVSVPVETGISVLAKQTLRRIAGWRGMRDYKYNSRYSIAELCKSVVAFSATQHIRRPIYSSEALQFHDHKGFNWRALRERLEQRLKLEQTIVSPIPGLSPSVSSQVWFIMKKPCN